MSLDEIDRLLNECGPYWLGGQRELIRRKLVSYYANEAAWRVAPQTPVQSMVEALVGTSIGFVVALISQVFIMWHYGLPSTFGQDVGITLFFTGVSIIRGYLVRRYFNRRHHGHTSNRQP